MLPDQLPAGALEVCRQQAVRGYQAFLDRLRSLQHDPLGQFLRHAVATTTFYRHHRSSDPRLDQFPVIDRSIVREQTEALRSSAVPHDGECVRNWTNGTLGFALPVAYDDAAHYDAHYFSFARIIATRPRHWPLFQAGRVGLCWVTDVLSRRRSTLALPSLRGAYLRELVIGRTRDEDAEVIRYLSGLGRGFAIYGKPHVLLELQTLAKQAAIHPALAITVGEQLYESDRRQLEQSFACELIDCYTATEGGLIAVSCPLGYGWHVQVDRVVVEVLDDDGRIVNEGHGELLLTNFMNWAQIFIRYRLGDRVTLRDVECPCGFSGSTITSISGRDESRFLTPDHRVIPTDALAELCEPYPHIIRQFQFRQQHDGTFLFLWIPVGQRRHLPARLTDTLTGWLGSIRFQSTNRIVRRGGKLRRFTQTRG